MNMNNFRAESRFDRNSSPVSGISNLSYDGRVPPSLDGGSHTNYSAPRNTINHGYSEQRRGVDLYDTPRKDINHGYSIPTKGIYHDYAVNINVHTYDKRTSFNEFDVMALESRQDISRKVTPRLDWDIQKPMTPRQKETKILIDNHNNINKVLDEEAQGRRNAATRTRMLINYFKFVKQTESSRREKGIGVSTRYLDTIDGISWGKEIKLDLEAKKQAIWLLHDKSYKFSRNAGRAIFDKRAIAGSYRNRNTMLAPFV